MTIEFYATKVSYAEALDGEITQVTFEEAGDSDSHHPTKLYLHFSVNYEFGSRIPTAEWFDGSDTNGGVEIELFSVGESRSKIKLENGHLFEISYAPNPPVVNNIRSFLARDCREFNA